MTEGRFDVVTGAFGYSGRFIARDLLAAGRRVVTLTNSPGRAHPFGNRIEARPLAFGDPARLTASLEGADVLYNTYWVRFSQAGFSQEQAVGDLAKLFRCAKAAGVRRVVHVSITNPALGSPFEYFRGKARVEDALRATGLSHTILRPAVLFGHGDILISNIAWMLRRFPVFGVFGDGRYRIRPIHVEDLARLAVTQGRGQADAVIDAVGPDRLEYRELVARIAKALGVRRPIVGIPRRLGVAAGQVLGWFLGDVLITGEEIDGLMAGLLDSDAPAAGTISVTEWVAAHAAEYGVRYTRELARRADRIHSYDQLSGEKSGTMGGQS